MNDQENKQSWMERLRHTYRLVIMNNETFQEIGSYKLSLLNVYIALSTIVVVVSVAVFTLTAFTPLREYIPGYGEGRVDGEMQRLLRALDSLEHDINLYRTHTENFQRVLVGDVQTEKDFPENPTIDDSFDNQNSVERSEIDEALRREVALEELGGAAKAGRTTNIATSNAIPLEQLYFTPPLTGEISAGFMPDQRHYGVDILAPKNTPVKAAMDGYVFLSDWTLETGNTLGIHHGNNIITFYKHNSVLLKKAGAYVRAGEAVAIIGNTGVMTDGPHLHFELWFRGQPVDPAEYINF
jgi:murein DD-endopeptidase MepM/ murein hydrolase activator NlpD